MEIQLTLTLSDRLFTLLEDKLPSIGRRFEKAVTKELSAQARKEAEVTVAVMPSEEAAPEAPEAESASTPAPVATVTADKAPETVRAIIHRTRQRFEGEDYKENPGSEAYRKYHTQLTGQFKAIASTLGYEKPSAIDTPEHLGAFARECDALVIDNLGNISAPAAPF